MILNSYHFSVKISHYLPEDLISKKSLILWCDGKAKRIRKRIGSSGKAALHISLSLSVSLQSSNRLMVQSRGWKNYLKEIWLWKKKPCLPSATAYSQSPWARTTKCLPWKWQSSVKTLQSDFGTTFSGKFNITLQLVTTKHQIKSSRWTRLLPVAR